MKYNDLLNQGNWTVFNLKVAQLFDCPITAIVFGYMVKKSADFQDEWFYCTAIDVYENTRVKKDAFEKARNFLVKNCFFEMKKEGLPYKCFYKIADDLKKQFDKLAEKNQLEEVITSTRSGYSSSKVVLKPQHSYYKESNNKESNNKESNNKEKGENLQFSPQPFFLNEKNFKKEEDNNQLPDVRKMIVADLAKSAPNTFEKLTPSAATPPNKSGESDLEAQISNKSTNGVQLYQEEKITLKKGNKRLKKECPAQTFDEVFKTHYIPYKELGNKRCFGKLKNGVDVEFFGNHDVNGNLIDYQFFLTKDQKTEFISLLGESFFYDCCEVFADWLSKDTTLAKKAKKQGTHKDLFFKKNSWLIERVAEKKDKKERMKKQETSEERDYRLIEENKKLYEKLGFKL